MESIITLLALIERPAAIVDVSGCTLAANESFRACVGGAGSRSLAGLFGSAIEGVLGAAMRQRLGEPVVRTLPAREGPPTRVRAERFELRDTRALLVLLDRIPDDESSTDLPVEDTASALRHDLSGPITAILGTAELALMRVEHELSPEVRDALNSIMETCARISDILAESRERGRGRAS